jgi:hypothetical protein
MIYVIERDGRAVGLTNDANAVTKLDGKHGTLTLRWANEQEQAEFARLAATRKSWLARVRAWLGL